MKTAITSYSVYRQISLCFFCSSNQKCSAWSESILWNPEIKHRLLTREIQRRTLQTILLTHPFDAGVLRGGWQPRPATLLLQAQGWDFTPSSPLRGTCAGIAVAIIVLKPVRVLHRLPLAQGVLLWLYVLVIVLVVVSLICREGWEEGGRTEELKLLEGEKVWKNLFPGMDSSFLLQSLWDVCGSRACVILRTKDAVQLQLDVGRAHSAWPPQRSAVASFALPAAPEVLGPWMLSWLPWWQPGHPGGDTVGLWRRGHEHPAWHHSQGRCWWLLPAQWEKEIQIPTRRRGFSCIAALITSTTAATAQGMTSGRRVLAACGDRETHSEANRRGTAAQDACTPLWLPVLKTLSEGWEPGAADTDWKAHPHLSRACGHPAASVLPGTPVSGTPSSASLRLEGWLIKEGWQLLAQVRLLLWCFKDKLW